LNQAIGTSAEEFVTPFLRRRIMWLNESVRLSLLRIKRRLSVPSVRFIGFPDGELGLNHAFRATLAAVAARGIRISIYPLLRKIETEVIKPYMPEGHDETGLYAVNIIGVATDELMDVSRRLDFQHLKCCYNILFTSWSLPIVPDALVERLHAIDEVWVPNDFLAAAFARIFNGPILGMPPPTAEITC